MTWEAMVTGAGTFVSELYGIVSLWDVFEGVHVTLSNTRSIAVDSLTYNPSRTTTSCCSRPRNNLMKLPYPHLFRRRRTQDNFGA